MVSIAVYTRPPPPTHRALQPGIRLRDSGWWYPRLLPRNLCLNEGSFPPVDHYAMGYRPLFWCHFGGPGGKYLSHLTGIRVASWGGIFRIHFSFDKEVPAEHQTLGRRKGEIGYEDAIDFSIDGPGGERIEIIKMDHCHPDPGKALPWVVQEWSTIGCQVYTPVLTLSQLNVAHFFIS